MNACMILFLLGLPLLIWALSYLHLAREFRTWDLRSVKIHETGRYTLTDTVFYYNHFLRELPIDTLYALALHWSYVSAGILFPSWLGHASAQWAALGLFLSLVVVGSTRRVGLRASLMDLFQLRERDELISWGSHWQMHFLSTAAVILILIWPGTLLPVTPGRGIDLIRLAGLFLVVSIVFRTGWKALTHPRWLLHGGREIFTYVLLIAVPGLLPIFLQRGLVPFRFGALSAAVLVLVGLITIWTVIVYKRSDLDSEAQSRRGALYLITSHFFEHVLDFFYIVLMLSALFAGA